MSPVLIAKFMCLAAVPHIIVGRKTSHGWRGRRGKGVEMNFFHFHPERMQFRDALSKLDATCVCVIAFDTDRPACHTSETAVFLFFFLYILKMFFLYYTIKGNIYANFTHAPQKITKNVMSSWSPGSLQQRPIYFIHHKSSAGPLMYLYCHGEALQWLCALPPPPILFSFCFTCF